LLGWLLCTLFHVSLMSLRPCVAWKFAAHLLQDSNKEQTKKDEKD